MSSEMSETTNPTHENKEEIESTLEEKLTNLIQRGWTLLPESCNLESCKCPLVRSLDGNKYCANCEMWIFDKEKKKQRFTDLVVKGVQDLQLKELGLIKKPRVLTIDYSLNGNTLNSLRIKLAYLSTILNETTDLNKTESILKNIELCLKNIKMVSENM